MADIHGSPAGGGQMPQAGNSGPAPVPYQGADQSPEPPDYAVDLGAPGGADAHVLAGVSGPSVVESAAAHDIAAGLADAPYHPGAISPVNAMGDADPGGRDPVAGDVASAVAHVRERRAELESDTFGQGSVIGDLMSFPPGPLDPGAGVGNTAPYAGFYDPPREYTTDPSAGQQAPPQ